MTAGAMYVRFEGIGVVEERSFVADANGDVRGWCFEHIENS